MSDISSALPDAEFSGIATVQECGPRGMITLRGDLSSDAVKKAVKSATGCAVPGPRKVILKGDKGVAWMSPDELLLLLPHDAAGAAVAALSKALIGEHALVAEVSDARAVFRVSGDNARDVMAKLVPVDLHPDVFEPGMIRRSHLAQVPGAFWMTDDRSFEVVVFRSVAQYAFDLLCVAAAEGSAPNLF